MKHFRILFILLFVFCVSSCRKDDGLEPEEQNKKTLFVYMPWSSNLTSYFRTNLADIERAILQHGLKDERVVVFFSNSSTEAEMYEIVSDGAVCSHVPIKEYQSPQFTNEEGLTEILTDMQTYAPAKQFAMVIGCHGMGWLPVRASESRNVPTFRPHFDYTDGPLTRYFGGLTANYQTNISTLRESLQRTGLHMEFILFDDCYMSSIEVAYELRTVTDHIIACPTEIMAFGMPYANIGQYLLGTPDYQAVCTQFYDFYSNYDYPYGTLGITDCREIDALASIVREINLRYAGGEIDSKAIQCMDGYTPVIFFDFEDYIAKICSDSVLLESFHRQLARTVPHCAHTTHFFSAVRGVIPIGTFCGITTSAPSQNVSAISWSQTSWYKATH